jgi:uracil phosphoribosyltransferase
MRAGLCFGMGIADELEEYGINVSILFYCDEEQWKNEKANCPQVFENDILLVDAVINTGNSIIQFSKTLPKSQTIFFSSNVISDKALNQFDNKSLYTVRISEKSFKGDKTDILKDGKGPDTGDRLFNTK